jgi:hypothetical protein
MPPPSPVWARDGSYRDAQFWMEIKVEGKKYASEKVLLKVKGAKQR